MSTMYYKLYKTKTKTTDVSYDESFSEFNKIYKKHDVQVLGGGTNVEDRREMYLMTLYKDKSHYEETVNKLRDDPRYMELSKKLEEGRESIEVITLESDEH